MPSVTSIDKQYNKHIQIMEYYYSQCYGDKNLQAPFSTEIYLNSYGN